MQIEESDSTKLAQTTQLIESSCEYLTLVRSLSNEQARIRKDSLKTVETFIESDRSESKSKLNYEGLCQLMIELGYFLFTCKNFGVGPSIEVAEIRVEETYVRGNEKKFTVVVYYKLEERPMQDMEGVTLFGGIFEHLETNLAEFLENKESVIDNEYETIFDLFMHQYREMTRCAFHETKENYFFLALEHTNLFYEYSLLYRIKNCSVLDYIRSEAGKFEIFKEAKKNDKDLLTEYNQEKVKNDIETLRAKERLIEANQLKFFQSINPQFREGIFSKTDKDQTCRVKFHFKMTEKVKTPFDQFLKSIPDEEVNQMGEEALVSEPKRGLCDMEFYVEYSFERNTICVRLLMPSLVVNLDTSDFLMFQSNVLTFQAVNVSIELSERKVQKVQNGKPQPKVVTFKGTSSFNVKEPALQKMLLLMDITMIASRIYEPQLNPMKYAHHGKDGYQKLALISRKVAHYTKMYMRCAKKSL